MMEEKDMRERQKGERSKERSTGNPAAPPYTCNLIPSWILVQHFVHDPADDVLDLVGRARGVDDAEPAGLLLREPEVAVADAAVECKILVLEARLTVEPLARVPAPRA